MSVSARFLQEVRLGTALSDWRTDNHYVLERVLGVGSTSKCFLALQEGAPVALKVTDKDSAYAKRCCRREARVQRKCNHKNIIAYKCSFERLNYRIAVLEYGGDETLKSLCVEANPVLARKAFPQMCDALLYLKSLGYLHRDIKLDNFIVSDPEEARVKLTDFGMAMRASKTKGAAWSGTPLYAAPELVGRFDGMAHFSYASEVYALGVCLYRMMQGHYPYMAKDIESLSILLTSSRQPEPLEDDECADLCAGMLDKVPDRRITLEAARASRFCQ